MPALSLGQTYQPVEVDLWGATYTTVALTRSVSKKADGIQDKVNEAQDPDDIVAAMGDLLDLRLKPAGGTKRASTWVKEKWKADELTLDTLFRFLGDLEDADRPT